MNDSQDIPHDTPSPASSEDFVQRQPVEGDVLYPGAPLRDSIVMNWEALTEPRLSTGHDSVGSAVASFFTREGGWVYLTQYYHRQGVPTVSPEGQPLPEGPGLCRSAPAAGCPDPTRDTGAMPTGCAGRTWIGCLKTWG